MRGVLNFLNSGPVQILLGSVSGINPATTHPRLSEQLVFITVAENGKNPEVAQSGVFGACGLYCRLAPDIPGPGDLHGLGL